MAVTVTNTTISALNTGQTLTANAATSTVANTAEVFTYTPKASGGKMALIMQSASTSALKGISYSIAAGDLWAAKAITGTIGSTAANSAIEVLQIDTARVLQDDGTILITVAPGTSTASLKTSYSFKMYALELL